jgi:hypothetical protein
MAGVAFVADDLGAWLVGLLADAGCRKLGAWVLGDEQERALRQAATAAVQDAAGDLCPGDGERAEHLAMVISQVFLTAEPGAPLREQPTLLEALEAGVSGQLAVLGDPSLTGTGQSSAQVLGLPVPMLTEKLATHLVREIIVRGSRGGPLEPLAGQLNHDVTHLQGQQLEHMLGLLASEVREALAGLRIGQTPSAAPGLSGVSRPAARELHPTAARELVREYRQAFDEFYGHGLHELVPLPLTRDGAALAPADLPSVIGGERHVQLTGPPGCGKSHLVRHTLLGLSASMLPVLVEGGMYEGGLSELIDRSTARFTASTGLKLLRAAAVTGQDVVLVVDGYNECPGPLRSRFTDDLMALSQRTEIRTLLTAQATIDLPGRLMGAVVQAGPLGDDDRHAVLASYGAADLVPLCEPFTTAFELSIAAECARELGTPLTRGALFAGFVRKRLSTARSPALVRSTLRQLALAMDERLATWLLLDDVLRISEDHLARVAESAGVIDQVLECAVIRTDQGRLSFTHELLGRFLTLEGLRQAHPEPALLARQLELPRHEDLCRMAVELESGTDRAGELLAGLADWVLYFWALSGDAGRAARQAAHTAARRLLEAVTTQMPDTVFTFHDQLQLTVTGGRRLSGADRNLLAAVGALVCEGEYIPEVVALLDATDAACQQSASLQEAREGQRPPASAIASAIHPAIIDDSRSKIAATTILRAARNTEFDSRLRPFNRPSLAPVQELAPVLDGATAVSYGRLMLLTHHLQAAGGLDAAALAAPVLRLCWDSGAYYLRLDGLQMIESFAAAVDGHPLREQIITILDSLDTSDFMINTSLGETLHAYRLIDVPGDADAIGAQIAQILSAPADSESRELAYGIVASQFEDIIAAPYAEAIGSLSGGQRTALYTLASLGSPAYGAWNDLLLHELLQSGDREALPAFQRWATQLSTGNPMIREVANCYILGVQGCAQFMTSPPELADSQHGDRAAWECYGTIIFWMLRPGINAAEARDKAAPYWRRLRSTLLPAAADPLCRLRQATLIQSGQRTPVIRSILAAFPGEVRPVLEWSLEHRTELTSLFAAWLVDDDRLSHIIGMAGAVGNADTAELLRTYIDDPHLGSSAITAIKWLADRQA